MIGAMRFWLVCLLASSMVACSSSFQKGLGHYERAEYPQALERFTAIEDDVEGWSPRDRAHYALYRGLTHFALGNRALARQWLTQAKAAQDADGDVFTDTDAGKLGSALAHLPSE